MSTVGTLNVKIGADTKEFNRAMGSLESSMRNTGKKLSSAGGSLTKKLTLPIVAAGGAALGLAGKYASMGDRIAKTSTKLGISTDALQEMEYWAGQNGMEVQTLERAVGRLNQRVGRAADGNEKYADAFEAVGVSLRDANGDIKDTESVMEETIAALMEVEDPALRSARASEIFGTKMARDLMPALEDGSLSLEEATEKIHEMGGVMSEDATKKAEQFQDAMDNLKREASGVFMELANKLIPVITDKLIPAIQEHVIPMLRKFADRVKALGSWFSDLNPIWKKVIVAAVGFLAALGPVLMILGPIITAVGMLAGVIGALSLPIVLIIAGIGLLVTALVHLWRTNEDFREGVISIWTQVEAFIVNILNGLKQFWDTWGDYLISHWTMVWDMISGTVISILENVKTVISGTLDVIGGIFDTFIGLLTGDWERMWGGMENVVKGSVNIIIGFINMLIGAAESMVNALGSAVNRIPSFEIPSWVPGIGGRSFGIPDIPKVNLPTIPTLHDGTDYFQPARGANEGLALLERGEQVIPRGGGEPQNVFNVTINSQSVSEGLREVDFMRKKMAAVR